MNVLNTTTTTYDMGDGFRLDIVQHWHNDIDWNIFKDIRVVDLFEAWVYHEDYARKYYMFGCPNTKGFDDFVDMAVREFDEYKNIYEGEVVNAIPFA